MKSFDLTDMGLTDIGHVLVDLSSNDFYTYVLANVDKFHH